MDKTIFYKRLSIFFGCTTIISGIALFMTFQSLEEKDQKTAPCTFAESKKQKVKVQKVTNGNKGILNNTKFSVRFFPYRDGWEKRYGVTQAKISFEDWQTNWRGNKRIPKNQLENLVRQTLRLLPHVKTNDELVALLVETIIVESDGGRITNGPTKDYGCIQMQLATSKSLHSWIRDNHKDVYSSVMKLRNPQLNERDNLIQNLPYAVAMMTTEYWRKSGQNFANMLSSQYNRAVLWKSVYNTRYGAGTINCYLRRSNKYMVNVKKEKNAKI